ncbi:NAD+ synthase [Demequina sp. TTPB684]|uniref:NAD+ synthase n=1 Tax=unclassified Demequina TaxID=2620311 RepID=UPI001CF21FA9|nr:MULTISPECIES: NAD+ synthase [unclassified Demequina]MCB2414016.1 NAD+ synthase [Demequina sp. TTPB684]UPU89103.1 NAD+ synthase [Demequina sp. TMPB413]
MPGLTIALAQVNPCVGDIAGNAALVRDSVRQAASAGAKLVALPEMVMTGYPIEDLALRESFQRAAERAVLDLAEGLEADGLGDIAVIVGTLGVSKSGRPFNQAAVLRHGQVEARYNKHHLPNYGVFDERRIFAQGSDGLVIEVDGRRVGVVICEDIWQDGGPAADMADAGIDLLVVINGSPFEEGKGRVRTQLARRRAAEVGAPLAYVNMWGGQDDLVFDGHSFIVAADGEWMANAAGFADALLTWKLPAAGKAPTASSVVDFASDDEQVYRAIVTGLRDYVTKNGFTSVVLGVSGGIDSALTAAIAADALGGQNVVGVSMPSTFSSEHSRDDAADLAKRIGADYRVQPIASMVDSFQQELALAGVAEENLQARVRGVVLMAISNREGHMVIAPGNKSELATGYATIYDAGSIGGFAPLKDVDKSRVWELARWRNRLAAARGEVEPIPVNSIVKAPSAELRPGQTDQDSLPAYDLLDEVLDAYVEHAEGRAELLARGFDEQVVDKVLSLVDRAEWKRRQYPPGPKVTALAFGRDRRLPITSRWREKVEL